MRQQRQPGEFGHAVQHRHLQHRVGAGERFAVVEQHRAQPHERFVDFRDVGGAGALVAGDGAQQVAAQAARRYRDAGQPDVGEPARDAGERTPARTDDEHALALPDERTERVDDRLRATRAGHRRHDDRVARRDLRDDVLLLAVGIQQQRIGRRVTQIRADDLHRMLALVERPLRGRVARESVEHGVFEPDGVGDQGVGDFGEGRHDEARLHAEPGEMPGERAQLVDDGVRLERAVAVAQRDEGAGVERDAELLLESAGERGVEYRLTPQLEFDVTAVAADRERTQQDRRAVLAVDARPGRDADAEPDGVDPPRTREFEALRRDAVGREPSRPQRHIVADELGEQRARSRDESRETAGVGRRELDARRRVVDEVQQRRGSADARQFSPPVLAHRGGRIPAPPVARAVHRVQLGARRILPPGGSVELVLVHPEVVLPPIGMPHIATIRRDPRVSREVGRGFDTSQAPRIWL
jgi:hypothetical protein